MAVRKYYQNPAIFRAFTLNIWDFVALLIFIGLMSILAWGTHQLIAPYNIGEPLVISLNPWNLPYYAVSSVLRMVLALFVSLIASFLIGGLAAKSASAERLLIPTIDILQAIPVLGFLSFTVLTFIQWFPGSLLGPQCAAIFAIFTSQAWNMILSFYSSLKMLPPELKDACAVFRLSAWRRFWHLDVPFALPGLIWNTMMSMSASWFFVVASEAITVNNQTIFLPGIGSYIGLAIQQQNLTALLLAVFTMLIVIILYDQLLFRPLLAWSEKFRPDEEPPSEQDAWFLNLLHRTRLLKFMGKKCAFLKEAWFNLFSFQPISFSFPKKYAGTYTGRFLKHSFWALFSLLSLYGSIEIFLFIQKSISWSETLSVFVLGGITLVKISILLLLASCIWVPIGVWIGLNPRLTAFMQPVVQFCAAFPANLFYPLFAIYILKFHLNPEIWTAPLLILGTQWYILFNVIAGTTLIPKELKLAAKTYQLKGFLWWKRFILPAILPYYITGSMAAAGGSWNASILADIVIWGDQRLEATGLGGYIAKASDAGDFSRLALGIIVMCLYVLLLNRFVWHKLYRHAQERYHYD